MSSGQLVKSMCNLENRIIARTFVEGNFTFAEGISANNKLQAERLKQDPELLQEVIEGLGQLALKHKPDLITYVPNGARMFAESVAKDLGLPVVHLFKQLDLPGQPGQMFIRRPMDRKALLDPKIGRVVIIEDISRTFGSPDKVLKLDSMGQKARGLVSIFHRGEEEARRNFSLETHSVAARYLPPQMSEEELARYRTLAMELN